VTAIENPRNPSDNPERAKKLKSVTGEKYSIALSLRKFAQIRHLEILSAHFGFKVRN
jgi:hypothetical protein